jgi:hypothetical protein
MPLWLCISDSTLLEDLMARLLRSGCVTQRLDRHTCLVLHVYADDADEAKQELSFFLKAWQLGNPHVSAFVGP